MMNSGASTIGCIGQHYCVGHGRASSVVRTSGTVLPGGSAAISMIRFISCRDLGKVHHRFTNRSLTDLRP